MTTIHPGDKVVSVIYAPILRCNLKCRYCFIEQDCADTKNDSDVSADILNLKQVAVEYNLQYDLILHGGECFLLSPEKLREVLTIAGCCVEGKIAIQSNLTVLKKEHINVLAEEKHKLRPISTTIDLPFSLHHKNRKMLSVTLCNVSALHDRGLMVGALHCVTNEAIDNLEELDKDFRFLLDEYPYMTSRFSFVSSCDKEFNVTEDNQRKFADYLIRNKFVRYIHRLNPVEEGRVVESCMHGPLCNWISYRRGRFNVCHLFGAHETDKLVDPYLVKELKSEECRECEYHLIGLCYGGCPAYNAIVGSDKSYLCEFWKTIYRYLIDTYKLRRVNEGETIHMCK